MESGHWLRDKVLLSFDSVYIGAGMNDFEYLFSFYALLLGLSVANVASGFGDMWRERHAMPVGVCTPLLGLVVLAGGMNVWVRYWHTQHDLAH